MKTLLILLLGAMLFFSYIYFNSGYSGQQHKVNAHTYAVEQFWYEKKKNLIEDKNADLPLAINIETLDYYIGTQSLEGGTYYFKTILVVNGQEIRIDTAVKPNNGIWEVDVKESFMGAHLSTLDDFIHNYMAAQETLNTNLKTEYIWGMGEGYTESNEVYLKNILSERFKKVEQEILKLYKQTPKQQQL
jgi:hypothetical protein